MKPLQAFLLVFAAIVAAILTAAFIADHYVQFRENERRIAETRAETHMVWKECEKVAVSLRKRFGPTWEDGCGPEPEP